jgi:hypothetical protein
MAKKRMAGDKLSQAQRNAEAREKFLEDDDARAERLEGIKYGDGITSIDGLDEKKVSQAYQGGTFGKDDMRRYNQLMGNNNNDETGSDGDSRAPGSSSSGNATAGDNSIASPISQANPISIAGNSNQVNQDNSISQTQNYDYSVDNTKTLNDNSVRNYGADGGGGKYGGADDSPAAAARFMDMYIDSNRLNQRSMRNDFDFNDDKDYSANDRFGAEKREKGLNNSIKESRDRADKMQQNLFGGTNPFGFTYKNPEKPDPIESDAKNIYENALKKIK